MNRRVFLQGMLAGAEWAVLATAGLLRPRIVLAEWPATAFTARSVTDALRALTAGAPVTTSADILIRMADEAEDGRTVPLEVISKLTGTHTIALLSEKNPFPALALFTLTPAVTPHLHTRIKVGESGRVIALIEAEGRFYQTFHPIKVAPGAC